MQNKIDVLCEVGTDELYTTPPHSRLYHLKPIGVGTPLVESLTSYCTRLAEAHSVYPSVLLTKEIFPFLNLSYEYYDDRPVHLGLTQFCKDSLSINGTSTTSKNFVYALEQLTQCQNLHVLTMFPFAQVLTAKGLIRRKRAWCSICYEEWREANSVIYDPLQWSLECVNTCVFHHQRLKQHCPNPRCMSTHFQLSPRGYPGYCSSCKHWLGSSSQSEEENCFEREDEEWKWQQWVGDAMGELLTAVLSFSSPPSLANIVSAISIFVQERAGGSIRESARQLQLDPQTIKGLLRGQRIPQLETLLRICARLGISPLQLIKENIERGDVAQQSIPFENLPLKTSKKRWEKIDRQVLQNKLEAIVCNPENPPLSMRKVGKHLGYNSSFLFKYFPDQCQSVSAHYLDYQRMKGTQRIQKLCDEVRQAVYTLHSQGLYPSQGQIERFYGRRGIFMEQAVAATWRKTLRALGLH